MRIKNIRTCVVYGRRKRAYGRVTTTALGPADISEYALVFVDSDEGITGIGEISSVFSRRGRLLARDVDEVLAPRLIGLDPFDITRVVAAMDEVLWDTELAKAGVEMAMWDIVGKKLGVPLYRLLGGKVRDSVPLSYSVPFGDPEEMAAFAAARAKEGFRTVKVKVGQNADRDVAAVRMVRQAVGDDHRVRVDANMAWQTAKQAIAIIRRMEPYAPELIEQPLPPRELDALAEIRRNVGVPIMVDESVGPPRDAMEVIRRQAADVVNVYVTESGGIQNAVKTFTLCELAGLPCMIGSMPEFGIGTAAQIHLGVAMANLKFDSDTCGVLYHEEDLLKTPLRIKNGHAFPPEGPGLGIELDEDIVARWREDPSGA